MKRRFNFLWTALLLFAATGSVWADAPNEWDYKFIGGTPFLNYQIIQPVDATHAGEVKVIGGTTAPPPVSLITDYGTADYENVVIPSTVTNNGYTYKVTAIAGDAFQTATNLVSVEIPGSVKEIENWIAYKGAFSSLSSLKAVKFNEGLERIGVAAFWNTSLTDVTIPASVTEIANSAFSGVPVKTLTFVQGSKLKTINTFAFYAASLTNLVLPEGLDSIGEKAFAASPATLRTLVIPTSVKRLNQTATNASFLNNTAKLVDVTVPARWASSASTATNNKTFAFNPA
ncbi:hypothetical protein Barb6XT_00363 [Bacteroidales bacterium Barb6XT]|nr:hypothetical protein Barb6XT_00363 [Bacteroidales bacterium Barb6XT]